jgi:hypothetical protein
LKFALKLIIVSLIATMLFYFLLDQKVTKNQVSRKASLPHVAFALQIRQNHGLQSFVPASLARGLRFPTLMATIVLPDFGRSLC